MHQLCSWNSDTTAVLHSIIRLKTHFITICLLQNSLPTNTSLLELWQTGMYFSAASLILFIRDSILGNQVWTIFIAWMPTKRSSSLCSSQTVLWITFESRKDQRQHKDKSPHLNIWRMTAAAWPFSLLRRWPGYWTLNSGGAGCSHTKPRWFPSVSQHPSRCSWHRAASIPRLILVLHTPHTREISSDTWGLLRNPEDSKDEKAQRGESREKQKV